MDAPQRPKLWLLRTRRFWFGMGILSVLIALWLCSPHYIGSACVNRSEVRNGIAYVRYLGIATEEGLVVPYSGSYERTLGISNDPPDTFQWEFEREEEALLSYIPKRWIVNESNTEQSFSRTFVLLPLWLPVLLWLIIWPLLIRRITRKEAAHFSKLQ